MNRLGVECLSEDLSGFKEIRNFYDITSKESYSILYVTRRRTLEISWGIPGP